MSPNGSKMAPNGLKWLSIGPIGSKLVNRSPIGSKWPQKAPNESKVPALEPICSKWFKMAPNLSLVRRYSQSIPLMFGTTLFVE